MMTLLTQQLIRSHFFEDAEDLQEERKFSASSVVDGISR
jgi:hypothetical protein